MLGLGAYVSLDFDGPNGTVGTVNGRITAIGVQDRKPTDSKRMPLYSDNMPFVEVQSGQRCILVPVTLRHFITELGDRG